MEHLLAKIHFMQEKMVSHHEEIMADTEGLTKRDGALSR
jgi:hypothetical protein